jgi:hypothetical protein
MVIASSSIVKPIDQSKRNKLLTDLVVIVKLIDTIQLARLVDQAAHMAREKRASEVSI